MISQNDTLGTIVLNPIRKTVKFTSNNYNKYKHCLSNKINLYIKIIQYIYLDQKNKDYDY